MTIRITKYLAVVLVFIIIPYFIDQIDGFVNLVLMKDWPIAKSYKTPILLYAISYTFLYDKTKKYSMMLLIFLVLFTASTMVNIHDQFPEFNVISTDLGYLLKIFSLPILYFFFVVFHEKNGFPSEIFVKKSNLFIFFAFVVAIVLSYFGFGLSFYGTTQQGESIGQQGYFIAGNEIGGFLILVSSLFYFYSIRTNSVVNMFLSFGLTVITGMIMGSKTAILGTAICFIGVFFMVKKYDKKILVLNKLDASLILTVAGMIFISIIFIDQILDFLNPSIRYFTYRYNLSGDPITFLTSGRFDRAEAVMNNYLNNLSVGHMLFGQGYTISKTLKIPNTKYGKAEMDFPDFLCIIGLLGAVLIYLFWIYIWSRIYIKYLRRKNELTIPLVVAMGILIINSNISGHILYSGVINPSLAYLAAFVLKGKKVREAGKKTDGEFSEKEEGSELISQ